MQPRTVLARLLMALTVLAVSVLPSCLSWEN